MTINTPRKQSRPKLRWLALAGVAIGLATPFSASAHANDNDALEVLVSAGIAYAVIDAAGGFDKDKHRHVHRHPHGYRDHRWNDRYRHHDRYHWNGRSHKRQDWHAYRHQPWKHDHKPGKGHKHGPERRGHDGRDGRDYRHRSYH